MLNFIKAMLKEKVHYKNAQLGIRVFNHLPTLSGYSMSVQCSEVHYCTPRRLLALKSYEEFEVAIFLEGEMVYPSVLENFSRQKELNICFDGGVFAYVPTDLVEDLYNYLNEIEFIEEKK